MNAEGPPETDRSKPVETEQSLSVGASDLPVVDGPLGPKVIPFRALCRCGEEVWIENDGAIYRLRRTRLGKLILTK